MSNPMFIDRKEKRKHANLTPEEKIRSSVPEE